MNIWLCDKVKIMQVKQQVTGVALLLYTKEQLLKVIQRHHLISIFRYQLVHNRHLTRHQYRECVKWRNQKTGHIV